MAAKTFLGNKINTRQVVDISERIFTNINVSSFSSSLHGDSRYPDLHRSDVP